MAIIDRELFDLAQKIRMEKKSTYDKPTKEYIQARYKGFHLFASKVFCGSCNTQFIHYYTDRAGKVAAYKDSFFKKAKQPGEHCENNRYNKIHEVVLSNITKKAINLTLENTDEIFSNLYNIIEESMESGTDCSVKVGGLKKKLDKLESERVSYLEGWRMAPDSDMREYFYEKLTAIKEQIKEVKAELSEYEDSPIDIKQIKEQLEEIRKQLSALQHIETLDRSIVENFVDRIVINSDGSLYLTLKVGPKFRATVSEYNEVAASLRKGEAVQYIRNLKEFFIFWKSVGKLYIRGMTVLCPPDMPTVPGIC